MSPRRSGSDRRPGASSRPSHRLCDVSPNAGAAVGVPALIGPTPQPCALLDRDISLTPGGADDRQFAEETSPAAYLGISGKVSSPPDGDLSMLPGLVAAERRYSSLRRRFELQAAARHLLPYEHAIQQCLRVAVPGMQWVEMWHLPPQQRLETGRGVLRHLKTCRNPWACAVCSSIITERRRIELKAMNSEARRRGLRVLLVTLTFSHKRYDKLSDMLAALMAALSKFANGKSYQTFRSRYGVVGYVRALEVTHSFLNGWHPHCHFLDYVAEETDVQAFAAAFKDRWLSALRAVGLDGDELHACRVDVTDEKIAEYVAKYGHEPAWDEAAEVTKQPMKRGRGAHRTPFDLLAASAEGDTLAGELFAEYVRCFRGKKQLSPSHGIYELLKGEEMATDDELVEQTDAAAWLLGQVAASEYRKVPSADAVPELLHAIGSGDFGQVSELLQSLGIPAHAILPAPVVVEAVS